MAIRTILALAMAGGLSQSDQDARVQRQGVANASSALTTFRAEGRIDQDLDIGLGGGKRNIAGAAGPIIRQQAVWVLRRGRYG